MLCNVNSYEPTDALGCFQFSPQDGLARITSFLLTPSPCCILYPTNAFLFQRSLKRCLYCHLSFWAHVSVSGTHKYCCSRPTTFCPRNHPHIEQIPAKYLVPFQDAASLLPCHLSFHPGRRQRPSVWRILRQGFCGVQSTMFGSGRDMFQ